MTQRLNTNKKIMLSTILLAFVVIITVVIFVILSLSSQKKEDTAEPFAGLYTITISKEFIGDSISVFINDSLITNMKINNAPYTLKVNRFASHSNLYIINYLTKTNSTYDLGYEGGSYLLNKGVYKETLLMTQ